VGVRSSATTIFRSRNRSSCQRQEPSSCVPEGRALSSARGPQYLLEPIPHVGRADALVVDLAMVIPALSAREDLHGLLFRAHGVEAFLRLAQRDLLIAFAMKHQKRATYFLHHTIKLEWLETLDHVIL